MAAKTTSFDELLRTAGQPIFVDFWAPWCGPCRAVSMAVQQIAREYAGRMLTIKINVDDKPEIAGRYDVSGIPTLMLFWQGQPVMRLVGAQPAAEIRRAIKEHWPAD